MPCWRTYSHRATTPKSTCTLWRDMALTSNESTDESKPWLHHASCISSLQMSYKNLHHHSCITWGGGKGGQMSRLVMHDTWTAVTDTCMLLPQFMTWTMILFTFWSTKYSMCYIKQHGQDQRLVYFFFSNFSCCLKYSWSQIFQSKYVCVYVYTCSFTCCLTYG